MRPPVEVAPVHRPGAASRSFLDSFDGSALAPRWRATAAEALALQEGELRVDFARGSGGPCMLEPTAGFDPSRSQLWVVCARGEGSGGALPLLSLETLHDSLRVGLSLGAEPGLWVAHVRSGEVVRSWSPERGWADGRSLALRTQVLGAYAVVGLELDAERGARRVRVLCWSRAAREATFDQGLRLFLATDWLPWEEVFAVGARPMLALGDPSGETRGGALALEWVRFADGPRVDAWANGKQTAQGSYDTRHWHSYDGRTFVPTSGEEPALAPGDADDWDGHYAKDAWVVQDEDGRYYLFHSGKRRGGAYSIGVAVASDVRGPWVKFAGNPLLAGRPGSEEIGLQFPAVVVDAAHPDPEWRWQMLYDGYSLEPVQHGAFLATAPGPLGPWTRRGRVLGPGAPGEFDELGCAGGVPLWWNGQWEVWYPALRPFEDTGIWSIGRAVGPSLDALQRDGSGPRVTQQSGGQARLAGPVQGRFLPLDDVSGFAPDAVVVVTDDAVKNNYVTSRVRRVLAGGIELYHPVAGLDPSRPTVVRQFDRASLWPRYLVRAGEEWWLYANLFGTFRGAPDGLQTFDENTALLVHGGPDPTSQPFRFDWPSNPPLARGVDNNQRSSENIAFVSVPLWR